MKQVIVSEFGGIDRMQVVERPDPQPAPGEVVVQFTSIGMNNADLMARRGEYQLVSGSPPFTPGLEGGGVIIAVGEGVDRTLGQRVILTLDAPASRGPGEGAYRSHFVVDANKTVVAPDGVPDHVLGALWLPFLTAWGCLVWKENLQPGQRVLLPAASSSVAIAASQVVKHYGGIAVGTTMRSEKVAKLDAMPEACYDHVIVTQNDDWYSEAKAIAEGKGYDIIFDPLAAGAFLATEIRLLAQKGTLWIYGLLGKPDVVDVTPLIRKMASLRGWLVNELSGSGVENGAYHHVMDRVADGTYRLPIGGQFPLEEVQQAHQYMEKKQHIGKLILVP